MCGNIDAKLKENVMDNVPKFLHIKSKNVLLAEVPKVGCSNWKKVILFLEGPLSQGIREEILKKGEISSDISGFPDPITLTHRGYGHLLEPKWSHGIIVKIRVQYLT